MATTMMRLCCLCLWLAATTASSSSSTSDNLSTSVSTSCSRSKMLCSSPDDVVDGGHSSFPTMSPSSSLSSLSFVGPPPQLSTKAMQTITAPETSSIVPQDKTTTASSRVGLPPVGGQYECTLTIPFLGSQTFVLDITSETVARLQISGGLLQLTEDVTYGHGLQFQLSGNTKRLLRRFRTRLERVGYDAETDTPYVHVKPPLPTTIRLQLQRRIPGSKQEAP